MRHYHAVEVVVLDRIEEFYTIGRRKVLLAGIEDAGVGIGRLIRRGYLCHVRLQTDDHRLAHHAQPLHLVRGNAHDERLARTHRVVADAAAILLQHPHAVHLRGIHALDAILAVESLQVEVGKRLVTSVVLRAHEAVKLLVIHLCQPVLKLLALPVKPFRKPVSDFVNLRVRQLYGFCIPCLDVVSILVRSHTLHDVRHGVVQGVAQQGHTVVAPILALHMELPPYLHVLLLATHVILVDIGRIDDADTRLIEARHVGGIDRRGNPTLTEVEVQVLEGDGRGYGILQGFQRFFYLVVDFAAVSFNDPFDGLDLLHHVSGNELVAHLKLIRHGIEEYLAVQFPDQVVLRLVGQFRHIAQIHLAVLVE